MNQFLWGALAALSGVATALFLKYWRRTGESLFAAFAGGFGIFSAHWVVLGIFRPSDEARPYIYLLRFVAFALIISGVVAKNRVPAPRRPGTS